MNGGAGSPQRPEPEEAAAAANPRNSVGVELSDDEEWSSLVERVILATSLYPRAASGRTRACGRQGVPPLLADAARSCARWTRRGGLPGRVARPRRDQYFCAPAGRSILPLLENHLYRRGFCARWGKEGVAP